MLDDMILRQSALIGGDRRPNYEYGLFLFEPHSFIIEDFKKCNYDSITFYKVKKSIETLYDSIHIALMNMETKVTSYHKMNYKIFYFEFIAIYCGKMNVSVNKRGKVRLKKLPIYLIIDFVKVEPIPPN
jgi:hypothetical protein